MIATRFRAVGWVAAVSAAALSCYLVSLQVASERGQLMKAERRILSARADVRQLETEIGTRARLVQLERWNSDVLGLQAPKASQYATGEVQLAGYVPPKVPAMAAVVQVAVAVPRTAPAPIAAPIASAAVRVAPVVRVAPADPMVRHASYSPASAPQFADARPAARQASLLGETVLGEIGRAAAAEAQPLRK